MTDWNKLKVVDLKAELKKRGLAQTGLKPALVARLVEHENQDGSESETTIQDDAAKLDASSADSPNTISPIQGPSGLAAEVFPDEPLPSAEASLDAVEQAPAQETIESNLNASETQNISQSSQSSVKKDAHESALPSVEPLEQIEDRQKRKRRSQSPPPSASEVSRKRFRQVDNAEESQDEMLTSKEDEALVEKHSAIHTGEVNTSAQEVTPEGEGEELGPQSVDVSMDEAHAETVSKDENMDVDGERRTNEERATASEQLAGDSPMRTRDSRQFKGLFSSETPQAAAAAVAISVSHDLTRDAVEVEQDRSIAPALHPATAALYIKDIMRPLNPSQLRSHLASLATPPDSDVDPDLIVEFYLDPIRTHAFVALKNISAASRIRNALHDRVWPEERNRKPLWVDFIPLDKVDEWIREEEAKQPGSRSQSKKWEVYYHTNADRQVTATLQEAGGHPPAVSQMRQPSFSAGPTHIDSARTTQSPSIPRGPALHSQRAATNTARLDQLFRSTITKPVLYWQSVPKALADKRLDQIDDALSRDAAAHRPVTGEINRYTFEDGDVLVDRGPEIFPGIRPPPGHRGPRGGDRRGGFQGRRAGGSRFGGRSTYDGYRRDERDDGRFLRDDRRY